MNFVITAAVNLTIFFKMSKPVMQDKDIVFWFFLGRVV